MTENQATTSEAADILVVADDIANLRRLVGTLSQGGYRVKQAEAPEAALQAALAHLPDLILLDVNLPGMSGFEVCRRLKQDERTRDVPVIFVSASQDVEDRARGFEVGGVDFVSASCPESEVLARVRTHLQLRRTQLHLEALVAQRTAELRATNEALKEEVEGRKRAQQALGTSENKYRAVVEGAREGILVMQDGQRVYHNAAWLDMTGYTAEEYELAPFLSLVHPDDLETVANAYRNLLEGQEFGALPDFRIVTRSGDTKWLALQGARIEWEGGPAGMVFIEDITERKRAEEALRESEERYRTLVEQAQDGIVVLQDGRIRFANPYIASLTGHTVEELLGISYEGQLAPDSLPQAADIYQRRLRGEPAPSVYEAAILHKDGSRIEVEFNAGLTTYDGKPADLIFVRDIRERVKARQELEESQRLLSLVIDHVPALVAYVDRRQRYRFVNLRYEQARGIPGSQFVGKQVQEILGPEGYAVAEQQIAAALAGETVSYEDAFEYPGIGRRWMSVQYVPDRDAGGDVQGLVSMVRDITERVEAEQALAKSEAHLRRAQEVAQAGSWELDLIGGALVWSDEVYRIFGLPRGTPMEYETFLNCVMPEDRDYVNEEWQAALAGTPYDIEHRICVGDEVKWVREKAEVELDGAGRPIRGIGVVLDITEGALAEEELRKRKERLEEAQRIARTGDWEYDLWTGKMTWSEEMYRIFGLNPEEYVPSARADEEFYHPDDLPAVRKAFEDLFTGGPDLDVEYRIMTRQGKVKACRSRGWLILDEQGTPSHARGTTEDITERRLAEQQILEYQRRLQALASQLTLVEERERRRIARELHDEVGQRLTFAGMALASARGTASEAQRETLLDDVAQSVRQAIGDIRDLVFDLSSPLMNELGLAAALEEWLENQVGKKYGIQVELLHDGRHLPLDDDVRAMLFRSVRELLTNVVKHAHAKSVIVRLEGEGTEVRVVVEDDGKGFDVDALPKATERVSGFGLFSIQERMAALGGSLELISRPGQGCKAILTTPGTIQ